MDLLIKHYKDGEVNDQHWSGRSLEHAKDAVCQSVRDGVVDRVEILNAMGNLIFHYPREMLSV